MPVILGIVVVIFVVIAALVEVIICNVDPGDANGPLGFIIAGVIIIFIFVVCLICIIRACCKTNPGSDSDGIAAGKRALYDKEGRIKGYIDRD